MVKMAKSAVAVSLAFALGSAWAADIKLSTDIVVVGAGASGLTATVQAAEKGKKVVLLEKNAVPGGTSAYAEGLFGVESEWNRLRSDTLTREKALEAMLEKHFFAIDANKARDYIYGSAENLEWLSKHDIKFEVVRMTPWEEATWHVIGDYKGVNHGAALISALKDHAAKLGVDIRMETPATSLIKNDKGAIVGVKAKNKAGDTLTITSKAVILATGSIGDNPDMIRDLAHRDPAAWSASVNTHKTGDGVRMAYEAGASKGNVGFIGHLGAGRKIPFLSHLYTTSWQPASLWVNSDGNRITNEAVTLSFSQAANVIYGQFGHYAWSIFDDSQVKYMMEKGVDSGIGVLVPVGTKLPNLQKDIDQAIATNNPDFAAASTVAGLAQKMGVPAKALEEAVKAYNHGCDEGHDGQFFKNPAYMRKLNTNKLYAIRLGAYHFSGFGGINTNRRHQVLSTENKPIPGLYAVGCEVSDMVGPTYTTWSSGWGFGFAGFSGRHAALNAVEDIK